MDGPYASAFRAYREAGWPGVLPLPPARKKHPPNGYTGHNGTDPSYADCQTWADNGHGGGNICLRLPDGIIGLDVDAYDGKPGADTLARLVDQHGALPPTWLSTSRADGISGIRLYRVPPGTRLLDGLPGIELIQRHHRYIVCQPSIHPEGRPYEWVDERSGTLGEVPAVADVPDLPPGWIEALRDGGQHTAKAPAADVPGIIDALPHGAPCRHIQHAAGHALLGGARHDTYNAAVLAVLRHARNGCPGARDVLPRLQAAFLAEITQPAPGARSPGEADAEWRRSLVGALQAVSDQPQGTGCPDDLAAFVIPGQESPNGKEQSGGNEQTEEDRQGDDQRKRFEDEYRRKVVEKAVEYKIHNEAKALADTLLAAATPPPETISLTDYLQQPDTPTPWRVEKLWPADGRTLLVAAAKTGKTTLICRNLLPALADGGAFLGRFDCQPTARRIAYLNMEIGAGTLRGWLRGAAIRDTGRITVINLRGQAGRLPISTPNGRRELAAQLADLDIGTLILDPLAPLLASLGLDEDSNSDVARFFNWWNETLAAAGVGDDLICHHMGHDGQRARGASRLLDEPDAIWSITRPRTPGTDDDDEDLHAHSEQRYLEAAGRDVELPRSPLTYDRAHGRLTLADGSPAQNRRRMEEDKFEQRVLDVIQQAGPEGASGRRIVKSGGNEPKLTEALKRLVARGVVLEEDLGRGIGNRYWTLFTRPA
jgi:hypothetical protein